MLKRPPAEKAAVIAGKSRRQLHTAVAFDPIKLMLITHFFAHNGTFAPHTRFQSGR